MDFTKLFNSKRRYLVLEQLVESSEEKTVGELAKKIEGVDHVGLLRELRELENIGLVKSGKKDGLATYFFADAGLKKVFTELFNSSTNAITYNLFEELPNGYWPHETHSYVHHKRTTEYFKRIGVKSFKPPFMFERKTTASYFYVNLSIYNLVAKEIVEKTIEDLTWFEKLTNEAVSNSFELRKYCKKTRSINLAKLSEAQLIKLLDDGYEKCASSHVYALVQAIDITKFGWTNALQNILRKRKPGASEKEVKSAFATLTTPVEKSLGRRESEELMNLATQIKANKNLLKAFDAQVEKLESNLIDFPQFLKKVDEITDEFGFLTYGVSGPGNTRKEYLMILHSLLKDKLIFPPEQSIDYARVEKQFGLSDFEKKFFELIRKDVWYKGFRKECMSEWWLCEDKIFLELGRRKFLSLNQMRMILPGEYGNFPSVKELNDRAKHFVAAVVANKTLFFSASKADEFMEKQRLVFPKIDDVSELNGDCACSGLVRGTVKIINSPSDMKKMIKGDVLVSCATTPDLMNAMAIAGAIVTDMGGITCHASIVSRELGIPCVIGTNIATKVLRDGDLVEVNANHGRVKILAKASEKK